MSILDNIKKIRDIKDGNELILEREKDQYWYDHAKKWLQIISTWSITICIVILALGFIFIFSKHIALITIWNEYNDKTGKILGDILDWTMKIIIGWLAKSFFEKQ
jgi:hypothetical protein